MQVAWHSRWAHWTARRPRWARLLVEAAGLLPALTAIAILLGPTLVTHHNFAYRDVSHYYYPLFDWIARQWSTAGLPLWNPLDNHGVSLAADPTASLFYPGKLIFLAPLDFPFLFKLYIVAHFVWAAAGMYRLLRRWCRHQPPASLAAAAYVLGGSVLIHYANLPFLVGAAWLPWSVDALDRLWKVPNGRHTVHLAITWAMITLGGDIQMSYHFGLLALAWVGFGRKAGGAAEADRRQVRRRRLLALASSVVLMLLLSAVQLVPSFGSAPGTTRAVWDQPRSVPEWITHQLTNSGPNGAPAIAGRAASRSGWELEGLLAGPDSEHHGVFQFSVGPWRWLELVWPNVGGRQYPTHRRWMSELPAEGRVWSPSVYLGLLPFCAAVAAARWRRGTFRRRWLTWTALLAVLAALGQYGVVWCIEELRYWVNGAAEPHGVGGQLQAGAPVGGVYWWLTVLLPGYVQFRYPAKWWVIAQFALCALAARTLDLPVASHGRWNRRAVRRFAGVAIASALAGALVLKLGPTVAQRLHVTGTNRLFGPLDVTGAISDVCVACAHALVVAMLLMLLLRLSRDRHRSTAQWAMVWLTAGELLVAHYWLIVSAPTSLWHTRPLSMESPAACPAARELVPPRWARPLRSNWWPEQWRTHGAADRQQAAVGWEHETLYPKHHLLVDVGLVGATSSMPRADYAAVLAALAGDGDHPSREIPPRRLALLGVDWSIVTGSSHTHEGLLSPRQPTRYSAKRRTSAGDGESLPFHAARVHDALPRAWVVSQVEPLEELQHVRRTAIARRTRDVWYSGDELVDPRRRVVIESDAPLPSYLASGGTPSTPHWECQWLLYEPNQLRLRVHTSQPGLLVVAEQYDRGWRAEVQSGASGSSRSVPVYRAQRIYRAVPLTAGSHLVTLTYRPAGWWLGCATSGVAWVAALVIGWFPQCHGLSQCRRC